MSAKEPRVSWYVRPAHFRVDQEKVLWPSWVAVARSEDLAAPGDYLSFDHAGEPLLVTRARDGKLRAFPNVCPHRGTTLVDGCGHGRSIQCPYHLWTFDLDGRLVGAPDMDAIPGFDRADHGLRELAVETWGGWVFVNLDPDAAPLMASLPELAATYPGEELERLVRVGSTRADQEVNWKIVVENFIESYHHAGTHPDTLQVPYPYHRIREIAPPDEGWSTIEHTPAVEGLESFTASCIFPAHLFGIIRPDSLTWFKLGIPSHDRTEVEAQLFMTPEAAQDAEAVAQGIAILDAINAQDEVVNRRTWQGLQSRFASFGPLSGYEKGLARFREWLAAAVAAAALIACLVSAPPAAARPDQLLWGDTHLHSSNSFDAYLNRNGTADPATAYRYARGLPVVHPYHRARVQIETPLDFLVVADHAEYLGVMRTIHTRGIPRDDLGLVDRVRAWLTEWWIRDVMEEDRGMSAFTSFLPKPMSVEEAATQVPEQNIPNAALMSRTVWGEAIRTADEHDDPGHFTTLIGWEFSSIPAGANLHRVVFTPDGADVAEKFFPWSSVDSMYPEDLWTWLDETSAATGARFVSIPHNSNISKGYMFTETTLRGAPYDAELAKRRLRWEPIVEVTQIKGDSETHPSVSPDDPFADFETYPFYIQQDAPPYDPKPGDYVRPALLLGLAMERELGVNPYRFGLIGSTDAHTGVASAEEPNFWGKLARDSIPENKAALRRGGSGPSGWSMSASGLAAVWAEENTRDAIYDAFRRREVYGTTGPRIAVRLFAGWGFDPSAAEADDVAAVGYAGGVPMGGVLPAAPAGAAPRLLVSVLKDPKSANLDRVQVVKGWIDAEGDTHEKVFDAVWAGDRARDAAGRVPAIRNTVDPDTASYSNDVGAARLATVWEDPDFDPAQAAFYYVRVLEIPTPRHSVWDALALGLDPREIEGPWWIQERAYTSPVWYAPKP